MRHHIVIQNRTRSAWVPPVAHLRQWAMMALTVEDDSAHRVSLFPRLTIRAVSVKEMITLNAQYRHQSRATNVLSFPLTVPEILGGQMILGDIAICAKIVASEAMSLDIAAEAHWAHMVVHGVLHLLGYDHYVEEEANVMEALETKILKKLGIDGPYF